GLQRGLRGEREGQAGGAEGERGQVPRGARRHEGRRRHHVLLRARQGHDRHAGDEGARDDRREGLRGRALPRVARREASDGGPQEGPPGRLMADGFRMPAERDPHAGTWIAWPSHADLWGDALEGVRMAVVDMATALAGDAADAEELLVLVPDDENERLAKEALGSLQCSWFRIPFGDNWLQHTAPN